MVTSVIIGLALIMTLVLSLFFLGYCLRHEQKRGAVPLAVMFSGIACWVLADTIHVLFVETNGNPMAGGGLLIRVFGIELTVIGIFLLGLSYTGQEHLISVPTVAVLLIKPAVVLGIVLSPLRTAVFVTVPAAVPLGYEIQPTLPFVVHALYSYGIALTGVALLGRVLLRSPSRYRLQSVAVFLATAIPLAVSSLFQVGIVPFDITPVSFMASALLLTAAAFRFRLLDTIPLAQKRVLDEMDDPVVVLDENDRIIMANAAGTEQFDDYGPLVGRSGTDLFGAEPLSTLDTTGQAKLWIGDGEDRRRFSITASEIGTYDSASLATVLVCRDITEQRRRQQRLQRREQELKLLKDLQSRVLRHNLRNELNVIRTNAELLVDGDDPPEPYEELLQKTDRLIDWSEKARTIERLIEVQDTVECPLSETIWERVDDAREQYPAVTFRTDIDDNLRVAAVPQIEQAVANLLDNAARHNTATDPTVTVRTAVDGDQACLYVEDNGPGIDPDTVAALLDGDRTELEDDGGFGLWMVYWVVDKSGGELSFDVDAEGTTVELRFERATTSRASSGEVPAS